ncbi:MAG: hypothetical protein RRY53_07530, partial [Pseudoflavonifractor sp.]
AYAPVVNNAQHEALVVGTITGHNSATTKVLARPTYALEGETQNRLKNIYDLSAGGRNLSLLSGTAKDSTTWIAGANGDGQLSLDYTTGQNTETGKDANFNFTKALAPKAEQPMDRSSVKMGEVSAIASGDSASAFYKQNGTVFAVGRGTSGELGNRANASENLPVQVGANSIVSAKAAVLKITGGVERSYDATVAGGALAPDYLTVSLKETIHIDPAQVKLQYIDGFNLYKDGYLTARPANSIVRFTVTDNSIGVFDAATVDADGAVKGGITDVLFKAATPEKTGTTVLVITVYASDGKTVLGVGKTKVTFTTETRVSNPAVAAGDTHSAALAEDGTLWLWGSNAYGQLGAPKTKAYYEYPHQIHISDGANEVFFSNIYAGSCYTYAIDKAGQL